MRCVHYSLPAKLPTRCGGDLCRYGFLPLLDADGRNLNLVATHRDGRHSPWFPARIVGYRVDVASGWLKYTGMRPWKYEDAPVVFVTEEAQLEGGCWCR